MGTVSGPGHNGGGRFRRYTQWERVGELPPPGCRHPKSDPCEEGWRVMSLPARLVISLPAPPGEKPPDDTGRWEKHVDTDDGHRNRVLWLERSDNKTGYKNVVARSAMHPVAPRLRVR